MSAALTPVKSSAVKAWGHDEATGVLTIETPSGKTYRYAGVPTDTAAAFGSSESLGRAWGSLIRGKFDLAPAEEAAQE